MASITSAGARTGSSSPGARALLGSAALAVAVTVVATLALHGTGEDGRGLVARYLARLAFPFFLAAFSASALAELRPSAFAFWLVRHRRWIGLSFAFVLFAHLVALTIFLAPRADEPALRLDRVVGGLGYVFTLLMAATSNDAAVRRLGPARWARLHRTGLYLLWFIFTVTYLGRIGEDVSYLPFLVLAVAALGLRIAAWRHRRALSARRAALQNPGCR